MDQNSSDFPLQQQLAVLKERLAHAQRYTALGELVGTTTHEFNNVLTTIINWAKHGLRHKDDATREKAFEAILNSALRGAKITQTILGMARKRQNTLEPTDLKQLLADTLLLLEREMNKYHIRVEVFAQPVPHVLADGNQIQQVLLNMLVNARQAMPRGGRVVIRLQHEPDSPFVDLQIRDFGTGIPPEVLPKIFDPFFTTKTGPDASGKGGTGLGLSACRDIIEAHNGRIRVESTVGKGTCFTIRLPVAPQDVRTQETAGTGTGTADCLSVHPSPAPPVFTLGDATPAQCPSQLTPPH